MTQLASVGTNEFTIPEPAEPNYVSSLTLEEQLRQAPPADARLTGSGTLIDNGWDRWHWLVTPGTPGQLTLQLQVSDNITWWKMIELKVSFFGQTFSLTHPLRTQDSTKVATMDLRAADIAPSDILTLEFSKAGVLNTYYGLMSQTLHVPSNMGQRIIYMCTRDHPSQP
jgi:hypothetical protein